MSEGMEPDLDLLAATLYAAVVSDACDAVGLRAQTFAPGLEFLTATDRTLLGWARTVRAARVDAPPERHYGTEIDYVDGLRPGDVVVEDTGGSDDACWGELFSTAATGRGARGAVLDGLIRDRRGIEALGFPVHARGCRPADSLGRLSIQEWDVPLTVRGVAVETGDFVIADPDGVVVVPRAASAEVITRATEKASTEGSARDLLLGGGRLTDVWERYRVL